MARLAPVLLLASCLLLQPAAQGLAQTAPSLAATCQSILVPAYVYPASTGSAWSRAIADAPLNARTLRTMVMNPGSGPGLSANSDYAAAIQSVKNAGGKTIGYAWTNYGAVPIAEVEKQVDEYITWYGAANINGIFLDSASSDASLVEPYYQPLVTYITTKLPQATVTLNAGTYPHPAYAKLTTATPTSSVNIVVFEDSFANFSKDASAAPAWTSKYSSSKFIDIVYDTSEEQLSDALKLSAQRNIGVVYITDDVMPNPYRGLPTYWKKLVAETQVGCAQAK
jgi:hypothetical protein